MAQFDLYVDTYSGDTVSGLSNSSLAPLPNFVQGDTISLRIYLLSRTPTYPLAQPIYAYINNAAISLKVALGPKDGSSGSTLYTQQFTWTADANNQYFSANFPLNTTGIGTLLGSAASASAWFEIEMTQAGFPTTVLQKLVTIQAEVIETGVITTPAGSTALSAEDAGATYLKKTNQGFVLQCPTDSSIQAYVYLKPDGTLQVDPIT